MGTPKRGDRIRVSFEVEGTVTGTGTVTGVVEGEIQRILAGERWQA